MLYGDSAVIAASSVSKVVKISDIQVICDLIVTLAIEIFAMKHNILNILLILIVNIVLLPTASLSTDFSFNRFRHGIFHVGQMKEPPPTSNIDWLGTAFLVDKNCVLATAKHLFKNVDRNSIVVRFQPPKIANRVGTFISKIIYEDPSKDLVFLKIMFCDQCPLYRFGAYIFDLPLKLDGNELFGEQIIIIGHPRLFPKQSVDSPVLREGIISSAEIHFGSQLMLLLDLTGVPGFSGSPVILKNTGQVIGVVQGPSFTKRTADFEWATPITQKDYNKAIKEYTLED